MNKILVPTDFSENAAKAAEYAALMADKSGATICFFHAIEPVADQVRQPFSLHDKFFKEVENARLRYLDEFRASIVEKFPSVKTETFLDHGTSLGAILNFAEKFQPDLIVMGTKGASGLKEIFIGSIAAGVIGQSKWPVITVPGEYVVESIDTLLLATNHFEKENKLLNPVVEIARLFSAGIHAVVFVDTDTAVAVDYSNNAWELNNYVDYLKRKFPGVSLKGELIDGKEFEDTIENYHKANSVDIIAMFTYHKNIWERIWKRSVTKKMAYHSKVPILAIPVK